MHSADIRLNSYPSSHYADYEHNFYDLSADLYLNHLDSTITIWRFAISFARYLTTFIISLYFVKFPSNSKISDFKMVSEF